MPSVARQFIYFNFLPLLLITSFFAFASPQFRKHHLNIQKMRGILHNESFVDCTFTTKDGHQLAGLYYQNPHALGTVIICNGLCCPKEAMAPIRTVFQEKYNILLFDARGHGQSSGSLLHRPWHYGLHDFHDVIAAINFVHLKTDLPIILYGNCAGAFHAMRAGIFLAQQSKIIPYNIKAIIFDSGWASIKEAARTSLAAKIKTILARYLKTSKNTGLIKKLEKAQQTYFYEHIIDVLTNGMHQIIGSPLLHLTEKRTNLYNKIHMLPVPILFIHSVDDRWVNIDNVIELSILAKNAHCWWITEPSLHATHHMIHHQNYHQKVNEFLDAQLIT